MHPCLRATHRWHTKGYMRILVTGGAGFIGSHLVDSLVADGHSITVLDNFSTGGRANLDRAAKSIELVQGSILDPLLVDELVERADVVYHLAAAVGVKLIIEKPLRTFITNIKGSENVLEAAHRWRRKVLIASTSEIYGKNSEGPFKEDDDRVLGSTKVFRWGYSTSKAVDEILAFAYHRERGVPVVVVRLFNTVGPRQTGAYGMVVPRLIGQALRGTPLAVYGDGQQSRCFCHVSDVVRALVSLMGEPVAEGDVFNVGSTEEVTIIDLAERIIAQTGSSSRIDKIPYEEAYERGFEDMRRRVPDTSKINALIGWQPSKDLNQIIDEVADSLRIQE